MALAVAVEYLVLEVLIIKINGGYFSVSAQNQNVYGSGVLQVRRKPIKIRRFINKLLHALSLSLLNLHALSLSQVSSDVPSWYLFIIPERFTSST